MQGKLRNRNLIDSAVSLVELVYHSVVRDVRKSSGNATLGIIIPIVQTLLMVAIFFAMYSFLGLRGMMIRGDFVVFLLTGIFLFLTHNKSIQAMMGADAATSVMMLHAPMTTLISMISAALGVLYQQTIALLVLVLMVYVLRGGLEIHDARGLILPYLLSWSSGCAIGMIFRAFKPLAPRAVSMISMIYRRANMITSGKLVPANLMGAKMVAWFDWNPLFHTIDQARGAAFVNYFPHYSNLTYPAVFTATVVVLGLLGDFWLRRNVSASWGARSI
ncbi:ABC transporter permease [Oceanomicrobium pacificus]|uniref:ABC transporter permease n=1 Tax=Oceanomicrobium pacificus TaxID=2692916 RepID=A0A6B0TTZ6_9RHOB|nr:ABC transporter permease [Oceanomicrobium pacificus]MXU64694.1 ABC transporter permease [Oceanomicrobium pacificus]